MKRYLVEAGRKIVLADGNTGDIKAFDGGHQQAAGRFHIPGGCPKGIKMKYPKPEEDLDKIVIR